MIGLDDLALAAGVDQAEVAALVAAGVVVSDSAGAFRPSDIAKVRLIIALAESGLALDELASAIEADRLSFDYVDHLMPQPVRCIPVPSGDGSEPIADYLELIHPILGGRVGTEDIREDELALVRLIQRSVTLGAPLESVVGILRAMARTTRHLVDLQRNFLDENVLLPAVHDSSSMVDALESSAPLRFEFRELGRQLVSLLMERYVDEAVFENLVRFTELALNQGGVATPGGTQAVAFLDVSGFTRKSQEEGDAAAAQQAILLADLVHETATPLGGRLVKSLGDGAMVHFPAATPAVRFALDAVREAARRGLWKLHGGVNSGPMLRRDADYFGTTVNVASRVADQAAMDQVMVTRAVVDAWQGGEAVQFAPVGEVALKNVAHPVELFLATAPAEVDR